MESLHTKSALVTRTQGTGLDIVLLHGWGMNSGAFTSFMPYLSDNFTLTTIDLPGFGENAAHMPSPYDVETIANAIVNVLPERCVLVGWSLGGLIAQKIALIAPEKLAGLITIASTPRFIAGPGWPGIAVDLLKMFEAQLEKNYQKTLERFLAIQAMGSETAKQDIKVIREQITLYPEPAEAALKIGLRILSNEDIRQEIGRIAVPTLRVYGRLDSLVPTCGIDNICELQPQADTVVLPHASHAPFISHPQQTANIILRFVADIQRQKAF